jgi:hypothetical protein
MKITATETLNADKTQGMLSAVQARIFYVPVSCEATQRLKYA